MANFFQRFERAENDLADDVAYGKNEDRFVRHARRVEERKKYGNERLDAWLPIKHMYIDVRDTLADQTLTAKQKIGRCAAHAAFELALDSVRVGLVYASYKLFDYLWIQHSPFQ